jgi:hypothetical protein
MSATSDEASAFRMFHSLTFWKDVLPTIPYIPQDDEVIPGTETIWLPKEINRQALTRFVNYWDRKNVNVANIVSLSKYETRETCRDLGLSREATRSRLKAQEFTRIWNEHAIKFQQKLFDHQKRSGGRESTFFRVGEADIVHYQHLIEHDLLTDNPRSS